jgi:hypothetical protein
MHTILSFTLAASNTRRYGFSLLPFPRESSYKPGKTTA